MSEFNVKEEVKEIVLKLLEERPVRHALLIKGIVKKRKSESRVREALKELINEKKIGVLRAHSHLSLYFRSGHRQQAEKMLMTKNKARIYPEYNFASKTSGRRGMSLHKLKENFKVEGAEK